MSRALADRAPVPGFFSDTLAAAMDPSREPAILRPGTRLGRYELLLPVGSGGMASVWAARLLAYGGLSKIVAIKTVLPHLAQNTDLQKMLFDEARIAAELHHPNVCGLVDAGDDGGVLYVVLEWVDGDSLLHVLRAGRAGAPGPAIGPALAARVVADACAGLHAAHELLDREGRAMHVVHRDVSPHNILLTLDGNVKVTDFGVAKAQGQIHQTTRSGEIRGKLAYMAPEQINASPIDRRSDVFGMGCVLYEASTGRQPFRGDNEARLIRAVLDGSYEPLEQVVSGFPRSLGAIVERALDPRPDARFPTAEHMRAALETWLSRQGKPTTSLEVGALVRERIGAKLARRQNEIRAACEADAGGTTRPVRPSPQPTRALPPASGLVVAAPVYPSPVDPPAVDGPPRSAARFTQGPSISAILAPSGSSPSVPSAAARGTPTPNTSMMSGQRLVSSRRVVYFRVAAAIVAGLAAAAALIGARLYHASSVSPEVATVPDNTPRTAVRSAAPTAQVFPTISLVRGPTAADAVTVGRDSTVLWPADTSARERPRGGTEGAPSPAPRPMPEAPGRPPAPGGSAGRPAELPANPY
jgi:serine/threonine-protein kinase